MEKILSLKNFVYTAHQKIIVATFLSQRCKDSNFIEITCKNRKSTFPGSLIVIFCFFYAERPIRSPCTMCKNPIGKRTAAPQQ